MALQPMPISSGTIYGAHIRTSVRGVRFDGDLEAGWMFTPSVGMVAKDVDRLGLDIQSFREPLTRSVKLVIIPSIRKNFQVGGRPPWEPLSETTIKLRNFSAWPILERSGRLRRAATSFKIWSIGDASATVRSLPKEAWYGVVHQAGYGSELGAGNWFKKYQNAARKILGPTAFQSEVDRLGFELFDKRTLKHGGAPRAAPSIPQRRFIMFQDQDIDRVQQVFAEWLEERAEKVGRFTRPGGRRYRGR